MSELASLNHFSHFGLPVSFAIDETQLTTRYYALQRQYHPDCCSQATPEQQQAARRCSMDTNHAFYILKDRLRRAEYLLSLQGHTIHEGQSWDNADFLMQQLALHEELQQSTEYNKLQVLKQQIEQLSTVEWQQLARCLSADAWQSAMQSLYKLKFFAKLQHQVQQLALTHTL